MAFNSGWEYRDEVRVCDSGLGVADFYASRYSHSSRLVWAARLADGEISLNGRKALAGDILAAGDSLVWRRPPWNEGAFHDVPVIYEDGDIVAVDKPAGLSTMPDGGWLENSLVGWLDRKYGAGAVVPAHRLNRGTSGIVLCARTTRARVSLARQFKDKTERAGDGGGADAPMEKTYLARSVHHAGGEVGDRIVIETPIGEVRHPTLGKVFAAAPDGRYARSECEIVSMDAASTLWCVRLVTGRPHQIRIHLASIGSPLLNEPLFLPGGVPSPFSQPGDCGYFLRAIGITFLHPASRRMTLTATDICTFGNSRGDA